MKTISRKRIILYIVLIFLVIGSIFLWIKYKSFMSAPNTRLKADGFYQEMPANEHHIYIRLPLDHDDLSRGEFTDFYILSPDFDPKGNVVFMLFDNQQEAVGMVATTNDFEYYDNLIGKNMSYVLIGNRGVSPTLFPEAFNKDGSENLKEAINLYSSRQQIEDIEAIREDMLKRGLLSGDGKISIMGGSGGGVLVQQFLDKYGEHVSKALILSSGAPDLSRQNNLSFTKNLYEINPDFAKSYFELNKEKKTSPSLAWTLFKLGLLGKTEAQEKILIAKNNFWDLGGKMFYLKNWLNPSQNFPLINLIMSSPQELEVRVRMWELIGDNIMAYKPQKVNDINLMYESLKIFLSDFINAYNKGEIQTTSFSLDRQKYAGEVLVWANSGDQDFGIKRAELIKQAYPHAELVVFESKSHHSEKISEYQDKLIKVFLSDGLYSTNTQRMQKEVE